MATSKTLAPTGVTIQIPDFTDRPDQRVNTNCIDKEADAINALNTQIGTYITEYTYDNMTANTGSILSSSMIRYVYTSKWIFVYYKIRIQDPNGRPTITIKVPDGLKNDVFSGNGSVTQMRIGTTSYITDVSGFSHTSGSSTLTIGMENFLGDAPAGSGWLVISGANMYTRN